LCISDLPYKNEMVGDLCTFVVYYCCNFYTATPSAKLRPNKQGWK